MRLKTITVSGPNEFTDVEELVKLAGRYRRAEIGVQVSGKKASFATARYWWLMALYMYCIKEKKIVPIALHINSDWVEEFCQGDVAQELINLLAFCNIDGTPFVRRVQLNFKIGREKTPDMEKLLATMKRYPKQRFILSYNPENAEFIQAMYQTGTLFDLLYDSSHGEGIIPETYEKPVFKNVVQGYSGGLSAENVEEQLWKISKAVPIGREFSIDAEGKLKGEDGHISLAKAEEYLKKASKWDEV